MSTRALAICLLGLVGACGGEPERQAPGDLACTSLTELPSEQTVTLAVENNQAVDRFVATACDGWTPVTVERLTPASEPLLLSEPFYCGCECAPPQPDGVTRLHRVAPGETYLFGWDARELVKNDCEEHLGCSDKVEYVRRPVGAGSYRVGIMVVDAVPPGWSQTGADFQGGGGFPGVAYPSYKPSVELQLPSAGDVTVPIEL